MPKRLRRGSVGFGADFEKRVLMMFQGGSLRPDSRGRVSVPADIRRTLGLAFGSGVIVEIDRAGNAHTAWKTIGILGGMGPEATAELYRRIIKICQKEYGAMYDSDFPPIYICSLPLPDIVKRRGNGKTIKRAIREAITSLENAGCNFVAVPCNTVFSYMKCVDTKIPLIDIVQETVREAGRIGAKKAGLLSTVNTAKKRLYQKAFGNARILLPSGKDAQGVNDVILRILSGRILVEDRNYLKTVANDFRARGADAVILGCTELPLLVSQSDLGTETLDSLQILAERTVEKARMIASNEICVERR